MSIFPNESPHLPQTPLTKKKCNFLPHTKNSIFGVNKESQQQFCQYYSHGPDGK